MTPDLPAAAILFDLDGVLIDSAGLVLEHWRRFASWYGLAPDDVLSEIHGKRAQDVIGRVLADRSPAEVSAALRRHEQLEIEDVTSVAALPGAAQLLGALPPDRWAVVTACTSAVARRRLDAAGLPAAATLIGAENVAAGKPAPDGYLAAARRLGTEAAHCVVIEDAPHGLTAGRAAGAFVVAVTTTHSAVHLTAADVIVPDLTAIVARESADGLRLTLSGRWPPATAIMSP